MKHAGSLLMPANFRNSAVLRGSFCDKLMEEQTYKEDMTDYYTMRRVRIK